LFPCLILTLLLGARAGLTQDGRTGPQRDASQGRLGGLFGEAYRPPQIQDFRLNPDDSLDSLIKDGKLRLTEADAIRLALENNLDITVERYAPASSAWELRKARAVLNPVLSFTSSVNRLTSPATSVLQGADVLLDLTSTNQAKVHLPFERGLDIDVDFTSRRVRNTSSFFSINPALTSNLNLSLTQHLLKDFGSISRGRFLRIAQNTHKMSQEEFTARVVDVLVGVLDAYWELAFAQEEMKAREMSLRLAEIVLEQNKTQLELGTVTRLDVLQAEAEVASRKEQQALSRHNRRILDRLKEMISSRLDAGTIPASIEVVAASIPEAAAPTDVTQLIQRALELRPEVRQLDLDIDNKKIQVDYARNQLRPTLDLIASYSHNGVGGPHIIRDYSQNFLNPPIVGILPGGFGDSLEGLFGGRYLGYAVGLNLQIPIGNDAARATSAQAQIDYYRSQMRLRALRQKIAVEVRDAHARLDRDRARSEAAGATVRYGAERLKAEEQKHEAGESTTRFILEAQRDLEDSRNRLLRARVDAVKSRITLDKAVGEILSVYGVTLK